MSNVLETRLLVKNYGEKVALTGIDLSVPEGKIVGLLGSNGSGKTTLLKLAAGLLRPTKGEIRVCGMEVGVGTKRVVSFLPERTYLNDWMRVADILEFFEDFYKDFADSLSLLDEVILADIYPAREAPIPGVSSKLIYDNLAPQVTKRMCQKEELVEMIQNSDFDVLVLLGAGDIENYASQIAQILKDK